MKVVTLFHAGDRELLLERLAWESELAEGSGTGQSHELLLLGNDCGTELTAGLAEVARLSYQVVTVQAIEAGPPGNVFAYNRGMIKALRETTAPFLWCEPDCVPLRAGWLEAIEAEYQAAGKPFMGTTFERRGVMYLQANGVYPAGVENINPSLLATVRTPVESTSPSRTLQQTHISGLLQSVFLGPPSFPDVASLGMIRSEAVLFHRCKDGSLIERLRERL